MYCHIYRGDFIESKHKIHAVVINKKHEVIFQCGNPNFATCIRSSFKPFQAYPTLYHQGHTKYHFTQNEIELFLDNKKNPIA